MEDAPSQPVTLSLYAGMTKEHIDSGHMLPGASIRILIAEDHGLMRDGLALILEQEGKMEIVAAVPDGQSAIEAWEEHRPDIGLIDLQMPILGGAAAIERILERHTTARLIVLTTFDGDEDIYRAMHAGAKAFLLKDVPTSELLRAIRAVHRGERYVSPQMGAKLADRMDANSLSPRELKVLRLIAEGKSNKAIATHLGITEGTVRTHVTNLMGKLGVTSRTEAAMMATKRGLLRY
ncbi:MAG: response regulator transcription factor [Burkholderiaceae bacterium]|jgi:two-component system NarL family response regulator